MISPPQPAHEAFFLGTYTKDHGSQGIYSSVLNTETGQMTPPKLSVVCDDPSYLTLHPSLPILYAVHERDKGWVSGYRINKDLSLTLINIEPVPGGSPCHLSVEPSGHNVFVASYTGGFFSCFPISETGKLSPASSVVEHSGSGPNKERQEAPHGHWIGSGPGGKFVYTCDLGTDRVDRYRLNSASGKFLATKGGGGEVPAGDGPRHGAFSPNQRFLYVNGEMGCRVTVFRVQARTGALIWIQQAPTLPEGATHEGNTTAEIQCHPNGRWVYVSNRGHDSIAVYKVSGNGKLTLPEVQKIGVRVPRGFQIDRTGGWLVAAGQNSNDVVSLRIDPATGLLRPSGYKIHLNAPVCVTFLRSTFQP